MQDLGMTRPWDETCEKNVNQWRQWVVQSGSYYVSLSLWLNHLLTMNELWVQAWSSSAKEHSFQQICPHSRMALSSSPGGIIENHQILSCSNNIASMISCPGTCTKSMAPQPRHMARHDETQVWQLLAMKSFPSNAQPKGSTAIWRFKQNMLRHCVVWEYTLVLQCILVYIDY